MFRELPARAHGALLATLGLIDPGEPALETSHQPLDRPYKAVQLKDSDGNRLELSEEGWAL